MGDDPCCNRGRHHLREQPEQAPEASGSRSYGRRAQYVHQVWPNASAIRSSLSLFGACSHQTRVFDQARAVGVELQHRGSPPTAPGSGHHGCRAASVVTEIIAPSHMLQEVPINRLAPFVTPSDLQSTAALERLFARASGHAPGRFRELHTPRRAACAGQTAPKPLGNLAPRQYL